MTHGLLFYADQTFLSFIKRTITHPPKNKKEIRDYSSVAILACHAAMEYILNCLFQYDQRLEVYDELKISSKIKTLARFGNYEINWGELPWQDISRLIKVRNWLSHFKDPYIGLKGGFLQTKDRSGVWVVDSVNKRPQIDPELELTIDTVEKYYNSVRNAMLILIKNLIKEDELDFFDYLASEEYIIFKLG
jgi:hypothetical protein